MRACALLPHKRLLVARWVQVLYSSVLMRADNSVQARLAKNLRDLREAKGWSQPELASRLKLPRHQIVLHLENPFYPHNCWTAVRIEKVAQVLGVDPVELLRPIRWDSVPGLSSVQNTLLAQFRVGETLTRRQLQNRLKLPASTISANLRILEVRKQLKSYLHANQREFFLP